MSVLNDALKGLVDDVAITFERDFEIPRPTKDVLTDPVRSQLAFYNERDIARFLSCFDEDVTVEDGDGTVLFTGHKQMYRVYAGVFESRGLRAEVTNEMRVGDWVIHHQVVHGLPAQEELDKQLLDQTKLDKSIIKQLQPPSIRPLAIRPRARRDDGRQEVAAAYQVREGLIRKVVLLR